MSLKIFALIFVVGVVSASTIGRRQAGSVVGSSGPVSGYAGSQYCDVICDEETAHTSQVICDTNGVTYNSQCEFNKASCLARQQGENVMIASYGACVDLTTSCDVAVHARCVYSYHNQPIDYVYPGYNGGPVAATGGRRQLSSIGGVAPASEKICGSDHRTYTSACAFRTYQCQMMVKSPTSTLSVDHMGECQVTKDVREVDCSTYFASGSSSTGGIAIEQGSHTYQTIVCPATHNYKYMCTLQGRTFATECQLCQYEARIGKATTANPTVSVYDGLCQSHVLVG